MQQRHRQLARMQRLAHQPGEDHRVLPAGEQDDRPFELGDGFTNDIHRLVFEHAKIGRRTYHERNSVRMLKTMITMPTAAISGRGCTRRATSAASGAASAPPSVSAAITRRLVRPMVLTNTATCVAVTKNSARFTEPIAWRGSHPWPTRLDVTIGPHPPPPTASRKPPTNARAFTANREAR